MNKIKPLDRVNRRGYRQALVIMLRPYGNRKSRGATRKARLIEAGQDEAAMWSRIAKLARRTPKGFRFSLESCPVTC